jgi:CO/xanthine dehydrogenase Mo-binding subunit
MQGQMEGGMLQGIGYASMEKMESFEGAVRQNSLTDYIIPTSMDTVNFHTCMVDNPYQNGPFGAKGAGELTLVGAAPAYVAAVENAAGAEFHQIPLSPEKIMEVIA